MRPTGIVEVRSQSAPTFETLKEETPMRRFWPAQTFMAVIAGLLAGCARPPALQAPAGVELTPLRTISTIEGESLLRLTGVNGIHPRYAVDCYRMEYPGVGPHGEAIRLYGLLALPRGAAPRRLVSYQHGTTTSRDEVPSTPDGQGLAAAIVFGSAGYAVVAPDYPGLGPALGRHPYLVADDTGRAIAAMIEAARKVPGVPRTPVFLVGFSQGGHGSLAALKVLEGQGETVLGSAMIAGAYDLRGISFPASLPGGAPTDSLYLAYVAWGYSPRYGHPLTSVLTPAYAQLVDRLFAGAAPDEIMKALPAVPRQMFNQDFLTAYDHGGSHWFLDALAANSLTDVTPRAPVRFYYGTKDTEVVNEESLAAARGMTARGANATTFDVGPIGHDASSLAAAPLILAWLGELDAADAAKAAAAKPS
ncbi:MAG: hypothetical protein ACHP7N_07215 [Caulobacterales bacterium]